MRFAFFMWLFLMPIFSTPSFATNENELSAADKQSEVDVKDKDGDTSLHKASSQGQVVVVDPMLEAVTEKASSSKRNNMEPLNTEEMKMLIKASTWMTKRIQKNVLLKVNGIDNIYQIINRANSSILHKDKTMENFLDKVKVVFISHEGKVFEYYQQYFFGGHVVLMVRYEDHNFIIDPSAPIDPSALTHVYKINKSADLDEDSKNDETSVTEISSKSINCWIGTCYDTGHEKDFKDRTLPSSKSSWPQFRLMNATAYLNTISSDNAKNCIYAMQHPIQVKAFYQESSELLEITDGIFNYTEMRKFLIQEMSFEELIKRDPINMQQKRNCNLSNDSIRMIDY